MFSQCADYPHNFTVEGTTPNNENGKWIDIGRKRTALRETYCVLLYKVLIRRQQWATVGTGLTVFLTLCQKANSFFSKF